MSRLDAYISRNGDFCANDDTTDYFTPCACARGKKFVGGFGSTWGRNFYMSTQNGLKNEI